MVTFASLAMQGFMGARRIAWPLRFVLFACAVTTVSPRFDVTLAATIAGAIVLALVQLRGRPVQVDVSA
jgi:hypothetical protein